MCGNSPAAPHPEAYRYIQRGSFNVGTAGGKYASAVDSIHHIQQQGGSLYQSAAGVRQHLRRQREVTAGEILPSFCKRSVAFRETPPPPCIVPWLLRVAVLTFSAFRLIRTPPERLFTPPEAVSVSVSPCRCPPFVSCPAVMVVAFPCNCPSFCGTVCLQRQHTCTEQFFRSSDCAASDSP
ncbi:Uncharacterised protein [Escherichia coli]|uniref:Uncharacterized protein n=1 Tax=Escherichia coli TaxID=562 RepID=A0A377K8X9_ECOLX|nr:Uncharacterised protein [Escherichia coli]